MTITNYQIYPQFPSSDGASSSGLVLIDSGIISSSVPWIKYPSAGIALPSGYLWFELMVAGIDFSGFASGYEGLSFAASSDAGVTFLNDTANADSYLTYFAPGTPDMIGVLSDYFSPNSFGALVRAAIYPGSVNKMFSVISYFAGLKDSNIVGNQPCITTPNPNATTPPSASRINLIRVKAYDDGDASNLTPAHGIAKAVWSLMGAPDPA